jgi:hypothetical protein
MIDITYDRVEADQNSINPTLNFWVKLRYTTRICHGYILSGKLKARDGKLLALIGSGTFNGQHNETLDFLPVSVVDDRYGKPQNMESKTYKLTVELTQAAVAYIENGRHASHEKTVEFQLEVETVVYHTRMISAGQGQHSFPGEKPQISIERKSDYFTPSIQHSEWINRFCPHLGIGRFILVELSQPSGKSLSAKWDGIYETIRSKLATMETNLRKGEWLSVMVDARQVFENLKVYGDNQNDQALRDEFEAALKATNHGEEGIQSLKSGIKALFDFCSKYIHTKDRQGNPQPSPTATKEEAEFVYAMLLGFINLLGSKLQVLQ